MATSIRTGLAVATMLLTLGGTALAQGASVDTRTRGSGTVGATPGGLGATLSGSSGVGGQVTAPGADVHGRTTGQGAIGVGRGGVGANVGGGGQVIGLGVGADVRGRTTGQGAIGIGRGGVGGNVGVGGRGSTGVRIGR